MNCPIETHQFLTTWPKYLSEELREAYSDSWILDNEKGYFGFIPTNSSALFVGTFPVPEQRTSGFFYHSDANLFWIILGNVADKNFSSLDDKLGWLSETGIGITDILGKAQRTDSACCGRADNSLNAICFNNIASLLEDYPTISDIFLTSGGPTSKSLSGASAGGWLGQHLRNATGKSLRNISEDGATKRVQFRSSGRELNLHYLITPAPQDDQLGKYLRNNTIVVAELNATSFLQPIKGVKEKYKTLQWAVYLSKVERVVNASIVEEISNRNLKKLLMERR